MHAFARLRLHSSHRTVENLIGISVPLWVFTPFVHILFIQSNSDSSIDTCKS
jgi:hypothetical protein